MTTLTLLSALGPYVSQAHGLRVDHLVVYPIAIAAMLVFGTRCKTVRVSISIAAFGASMAFIAAWTFVVSTLGPHDTPMSALLAGMDNYLQPIALLAIATVGAALTPEEGRTKLFDGTLAVVVWLIALNGFLAAANSIGVLEQFSAAFWPAGGADGRGTVASRALTMGRYGGVFNQPFEAGLSYSVALVAWMYRAAVSRAWTSSAMSWVAFVGIALGGILSVSKVFFPLATILCALTAPLLFRWHLRHLRLAASIAAIVVVVWLVVAPHWAGASYFARLVDPTHYRSEGLVTVLTAGRLDGLASGGRWDAMAYVARTEPLTGYGFWHQDLSVISGSLDSAYFEILGQGGLPALAAYLVAISALVLIGAANWRKSTAVGALTLALVSLTIVAGLGGPTLTLNRASVFLNLVLFLSVALPARRRVSTRLLGSESNTPSSAAKRSGCAA